MFDVGKSYVIHEIEGGVEGYSSWKIVSVEMPLIKISNGINPDRILNTSSPSFVRAEISQHDASKVPVLDLGMLDEAAQQSGQIREKSPRASTTTAFILPADGPSPVRMKATC